MNQTTHYSLSKPVASDLMYPDVMNAIANNAQITDDTLYSLQNSITSINGKVTRISNSQMCALTTTMSDTGVSLVIPAKKLAIVTASITYNNKEPVEIGIVDDSNNCYVAHKTVESGYKYSVITVLTVIYTGTFSYTYKAFARVASAGNDAVTLSAVLLE